MIHSSRLIRTLKFLDSEYKKNLTSYDPHRPLLFAKLAVIEYCGWLELSFDEIARCGVRKKLKTESSRDILEKKIKSTHGFSYKHHVRPLLAQSIGTIRLLQLEKEISKDGSLDMLSSNLGSLKEQRSEAAHTFVSGRTLKYNAPSVTINNFKKTEPIILEMWKWVQNASN